MDVPLPARTGVVVFVIYVVVRLETLSGFKVARKLCDQQRRRKRRADVYTSRACRTTDYTTIIQMGGEWE